MWKLTGKVKIGIALESWDGSAWGPEYLSLEQGERLQAQEDAEPSQSSGWAFGYSLKNDKCGWFPPDFIKYNDGK